MAEYRCKHCDKVVIKYDEPLPYLIYGDKCRFCGGNWDLIAFPSRAFGSEQTREVTKFFLDCPKCDGENYPRDKECQWCQNPLNFGDKTGYISNKKVFMTKREALVAVTVVGLIYLICDVFSLC
jgi:hypothetical protein